LYELIFALHSALSADPPSEMISRQHQMKPTSAELLTVVIVSITSFVVSHNLSSGNCLSEVACHTFYDTDFNAVTKLQGICEKRTAMTVCSKVVFSRSNYDSCEVLRSVWVSKSSIITKWDLNRNIQHGVIHN